MASTIIHWLSYAMFLYLFGKASLLKIFLNPTMMEGMASLGFGKAWTLTIGYLEDLDRSDVNDLKNFFLRWYGPNNATLTVGGDVKTSEVLKIVEVIDNR